VLRLALAAMAVVLALSAGAAESKQAATQRLQRDYPAVRFFTSEGKLSRVYGTKMSAFGTPERSADAFLRAYSDAFGVPSSNLVFEAEHELMQGKFTVLHYRQFCNGLEVDRAYLTVLVKNEPGYPVVLASANVYDITNVALTPIRIGVQDAMARWARWYPDFTFSQPEFIVYAQDGKATYAYRFTGSNGNPDDPEAYEFIVDASKPDAPLLRMEDRILYVDVTGQVLGYATPGVKPDRTDNPPTIQPIRDIWVRLTGGNAAYTDASGNYVIPHGGSSDVTLSTSVGGSGATQAGRWVRLTTAAGSILSLSQTVTPPGPGNFLYNPTPSEYLTAQMNGFIWTTNIHNFVKQHVPTYPGVDVQLPCNVNLNNTCNAYYDYSSINFYRAGGGCPNTAYSSVIAHEYGHHIVYSGHTSATGDYHEGMADVSSAFLLQDPCLGYGFLGGNACLRNCYNTVNYPCSGEAHLCGQVLSGAFWLTRDQLMVTEPVEYHNIISALWLNSILLRPPSVNPGITIDVLTLDDDNGDIADGTPHYNEIATGFGAKNLTAPPLSLLKFTFPDGQPETVSPAGGTTMRVVVSALSKQPQPGTGKLHYSTGGGYTEIAMNEVSPNVYDAVFPAIPCGTTINYYVSARTTENALVTSPSNAPTSTYKTISAGSLVTVFSDNFNTNQGWTVQNSSGLTAGAWQRAIPNGGGTRGDPPTDYDGSGYCYVTQNGPGDTDVDGGTTYLISPTFDLSGGDAIISYARWYSNNFGNDPYNDVFIVSVSNNNGASWVTAEVVGPTGPQVEGGWYTSSFKVGDFVTPNATVKVRFEAGDLNAGSVIEAGVDAVKVTQIGCETPASLSGTITLNGLIPSPAGINLTIEFRNPGTQTVVASYPVTLDGSGGYAVPSVLSGTFDIAVKHANWLRQVLASQNVSGATVANFSLINGDANYDNAVDLIDLNAVLAAFGLTGQSDVNWDGTVDLLDLNIVLNNFGFVGAP